MQVQWFLFDFLSFLSQSFRLLDGISMIWEGPVVKPVYVLLKLHSHSRLI